MAVLAGLWLLTLSVWAAATYPAWPPGWVASAVLGAGLWLWCAWLQRRSPTGHLLWQPSADHPHRLHWQWHSAAYRQGVDVTHVRCVLDVQVAMLLHVRTRAGLALWLWASARRMPQDWGRLRQAVHASAAAHRV